ncbi:DUF1893 domain-containing protein [candidate division KSB1 bacterium]|nr:DUF1893 domain-containing protein [candidate division KSB1 bacterium]
MRKSRDGHLNQTFDEKLAVLAEKQLSLMVEKNGQILCSSADSMLAPLLQCLKEHGQDMAGALVIDKIVGAAAAHLMVVGQVAQVATPVASQAALEILARHGIPVYARQTIPRIQNRDHTDLCPMEKLALQFTSSLDFYHLLLSRQKS